MSIICLCAHAYQALLRLDRANHTIRFPRKKIATMLQNTLIKAFCILQIYNTFKGILSRFCLVLLILFELHL